MKNQSKVVFVSPVPRIASQGRDKQSFTIVNPVTGEMITGNNMQKTRELGTAAEYNFPYNPTTNRLETGLEVSIPNPVYQLTPEEVMEKYSLSHQWRDQLTNLVNQKEIKKQTWYEIIDDVQPGFYTSEIAGGVTIFNASKSTKVTAPNFLQTFKIVLYDGPNRFEDDGTKNTSRGRLAIELIKIHGRIANSKNEVNSTKHHFYVSEENEAEMERSRKQDIIDEAAFNKVKLQREGGDFKNYQVASLLTFKNGKSVVSGQTPPDTVKRVLTNYLSEGTDQMDNISKFNKLIELLNTKEGREKFDIMFTIQQAINTGTMVVRDGYYVWNSKSTESNLYKNNNYDKLISFFQAEKRNWNPKDTTTTNWYADLYNEIKSKGGILE